MLLDLTNDARRCDIRLTIQVVKRIQILLALDGTADWVRTDWCLGFGGFFLGYILLRKSAVAFNVIRISTFQQEGG